MKSLLQQQREKAKYRCAYTYRQRTEAEPKRDCLVSAPGLERLATACSRLLQFTFDPVSVQIEPYMPKTLRTSSDPVANGGEARESTHKNRSALRRKHRRRQPPIHGLSWRGYSFLRGLPYIYQKHQGGTVWCSAAA